MQEVANENVTVRLNTDMVSMSIRAAQMFQDPMLQSWSNHVSLREITIQIEISKPTDQMVQKIQHAMMKEGCTLVARPYRFSIVAVHHHTMIPLNDFGHSVERTITMPAGRIPNQQVNAIICGHDGSTCTVPSKIIKLNGESLTEIRSVSNSVHAVIRKT